MSMDDALRLGCLNPARVMGIEHQKGSLSEGKDADFVVINEDYVAQSTYVEGILAFNGESVASIGNPDFTKRLIEEA